MQLKEVKGVGKVAIEKLKKLGINDVKDLVGYLPGNYVDLSSPVALRDAEDGQFVLVAVKVNKVGGEFRKSKSLSFFKLKGECAIGAKSNRSDIFDAIWFNQPYLRKGLREGTTYFFWGKIKCKGSVKEMVNPAFEEAGKPRNLCGIIPVYKTKGLFAQSLFRNMVKEALGGFSPASVISERIAAGFGLDELGKSYLTAHAPQSIDEGLAAQKRILTEDTVNSVIAYRLLVKSCAKSREYAYSDDKTEVYAFLKSLPFRLTPSQERATEDIFRDLCSDSGYMNRILSGDVGSGKTVVAFAAMYYAVISGYQTALMAPTEILARQHYLNALKFFKDYGLKTVFLASSLSAAERRAALSSVASGEADIVIGTHSIIQKDVVFKNLALAVIDEQHKFGVNQKSLLEQMSVSADTLTLSATPIPRAMALILYDNLKVSHIEKREDTVPVSTFVLSDDKLPGLYRFIGEECDKGGKAFIVCPRIVDGEGMDLYSAEQLYKELSSGVFRNRKTALLHGGLSKQEKESVMAGFAGGDTQILICTTVVEVGIDVPDATVMAVLNSERMGLASLHQLRGRIGRGSKPGYCFLHVASEKAQERVKIMENYSDGLKIAELDFDLRGGGDFLGTRQTGETLTTGAVRLSADIIKRAGEIADSVMQDGEYLENLSALNLTLYYEKLKDVSVN